MLLLIRKGDIQHSSKGDDAFRRYIAEILPTKRKTNSYRTDDINHSFRRSDTTITFQKCDITLESPSHVQISWYHTSKQILDRGRYIKATALNVLNFWSSCLDC